MDNDDSSKDVASNGESAAVSSEVVAEKKFTQDELNSIVGGRAKDAAEKVRREYESKMQDMHQRLNNQPTNSVNNNDLSVNFDEKIEAVLQKREEERQQKAFDEHINHVASDFSAKINSPELAKKYDDYESVVQSEDASLYPNFILMAKELGLENTPEVYYHLISTEKIEDIELKAGSKFSEKAKRNLKKISSQLKGNEQAKAGHVKTSKPLSRIKPGTMGVDNGKQDNQSLIDRAKELYKF